MIDCDNKKIEDLLSKWKFSWSTMEVMIGGKSSVDLTKLRIRDWRDATDFLKHYGYDPDNSNDARYIHSVIIEALHFIEHRLMTVEWSRGRIPPEEILYADDARSILLHAGDMRRESAYKQAWACAVLRVMHTIAHLEGVRRMSDIEVAREQIMSQFRQFVFRDKNGQLRFGSTENNIELHSVDWKHQKSRDSIIIKLLHKKANVAEDIFDLLGVRLITEHLCDVMVAVKYLRDFHIITFVNCTPSRARNSLIDVENFKYNVELLHQMHEQGKINSEEFALLIQHIIAPMTKGKSHSAFSPNPHSNSTYRSVQLTCRQLIHFPNSYLQWRTKIERLRRQTGLTDEFRRALVDIVNLSDKWRDQADRGGNGFFPFEVHVLDKESALINELGNANHEMYKRSQLRSVRKRVLHRVLSIKKPVKADA